jgi:hypothetical protein
MVEEVMGVVMGVSAATTVSSGPATGGGSERNRSRTRLDLQARLAAAHATLEAANVECDRLAAMCADAASNPSDTGLALRQAMSLKNSAMADYTNALRDWTEFHLDTNR